MAEALVTPDGKVLEICECGDETCITWPVDADGLYISNADMENLIAERCKLIANCTRVPEKRVSMIVNQCPNCYGVLTPQGIIWQCDDYHPEVLAQMTQQDQASTDDSRDEESS